LIKEPAMQPNLDIDLLKTFIAIAEHGSFTRAAEEVHKTQSAVSMQMKRLEDVIARPLFVRDGRQNRLTGDGDRLLEYAQRLVRLNDETVASFQAPEMAGLVRFGTPDDYADRFLPEILARFSRTHPMVQVDVDCMPSRALAEKTRAGEIDLSLLTCETDLPGIRNVRTEPLVWVSSTCYCVHDIDPLPVALSTLGCAWRQLALDALDRAGRRYRIAYASSNSNAVNAAVLAGLAVGAIPELLIRPGMRRLGEAEGLPPLGEFGIGLMRTPGRASTVVDALERHIADSLADYSSPLLAAV